MVQASLTQSFTKVYHKKPYPAISPLRPELSARGKTVVVTGGHQGIGLAIANSFAQAQASNVIILARRAEVLDKAKCDLAIKYPETAFHTFAVSITDEASIAATFSKIRADIGEPDVAVLCAAYVAASVRDVAGEIAQIRDSWKTNIEANMNLVRETIGPATEWKKPGEVGYRPKTVIEINSAAAHIPTPQNASAYNGSKAAIARMFAIFQREIDLGSHKWPEGLRLFNLHPGGILTETALRVGSRKEDFPWDDAGLPGNFCVWLASPEATFLKGKFLWANWDVDEMIARRDEILKEDLLKIGLYADGPYPVDIGSGMQGVFSEKEMASRHRG